MESKDANALLGCEPGALEHFDDRFVYVLANAVADLRGINLKMLLSECFPAALKSARGTSDLIMEFRFSPDLFDNKVRAALRATGAVFKSDFV
jgi:hypothetical protein